MVNYERKKKVLRKAGPLSAQMLKQKTKLRLKNRRTRERLKEFIREVRSRNDEGYSASQLLKSYIPDLGGEVPVTEAEIKAEMKKQDHHIQLLTQIPSPCNLGPMNLWANL